MEKKITIGFLVLCVFLLGVVLFRKQEPLILPTSNVDKIDSVLNEVKKENAALKQEITFELQSTRKTVENTNRLIRKFNETRNQLIVQPDSTQLLILTGWLSKGDSSR